MAKNDRTVWGIHGGKTGDADGLFLKKDVVALAWVKVGDIGLLPADREAFKQKLQEVMPERKKGYFPVAAGQLFRFAHDMKAGDVIVYPSKQDRQVHIGEITGPYKFDLKTEPGYPQQRAVKWIKAYPRSRFSQGALYEIGSAMSFFQVKTYNEEFLGAIEGKAMAPPVQEDVTVSYVFEEIEQNTRDFVIKKLAQELKGHGLAEFVAHLLNAMGYRTRVSPAGPDGGVDIIAHKDELGFEKPLIKVQVKSGEGNIGEPIISQLNGIVEKDEFGMVVTLGTFTNQAVTFVRNKSNIRLIDGEDLVSLIFHHYDSFDSKYKAMIPLKHVYVPESVDENEEE